MSSVAASLQDAHARVRRTYGAAVGRHRDDVITPALMLDRAAAQHNITKMADRLTTMTAELRPHIKVHKSPELARLQVAAGAIGISTATVWEAIVMVGAGLDGIFVVNTVAGRDKIAALGELAREANVMVAVGIDLADFDQIAAFAKLLVALPGIDFQGITTHRGKFDERLAQMTNDEAGVEEGQILVDLADRLRSVGIPVREVTAGGTMTGRGVAMVDGVTEVRAGTYVFFDAMQVSFGAAEPDEVAVSILSTVVSRRRGGWATIDGGSKTFSGDRGVTGSGAPGAGVIAEAVGIDASVMRLTEEHGMVGLGGGTTVEIGQRIQFTPFHVCTAVSLSRELVAVRSGVVEEVWPVLARGCRT